MIELGRGIHGGAVDPHGVVGVPLAMMNRHGLVAGATGDRVQHALRVFTPQDAKALKAAVSTYPVPEEYDLEEPLPALGSGEAVVTHLDAKGVPTPVVHTRMRPPQSRMAPADDIDGPAKASPLWATYGTRTESHSAREMLENRIAQATAPEAEPVSLPTPVPQSPADLGDFLESPEAQRLKKEVMRGVFGALRKRL